MRRMLSWFCLLAVGVGAGCRPTPTTLAPTAEPQPASDLSEASRTRIIAQGRAIAGQAFQALAGRLKQAIDEGGIVSAVPYCSTVALPLTSEVATSNQVALQRVSHRPRNPAAAASPQELLLIRRFQERLLAAQPLEPAIVLHTNGHLRFYAPIVLTNDLCLKCHGQPEKEVSMDALLAIRQKYPRDEATGFKLGDLRGLWRIEFPPSITNPPPPGTL